MGSKSEISHANNVANFDFLIAFVLVCKDAFKPSNAAIGTASLQSVASAAKNAMGKVNDANSANNSATAARKVMFAPLNKLATKVVNSVRSTDASQEVVNQINALVRKLRGTRATPKKTEEEKLALAAEGKEVVEISGSQLGYDNRVANFDKMIRLLAGISLYAPNENELKLSELKAYYNQLNAVNEAVIKSSLSLGSARNSRSVIMYQETSGLVDLALATKNYIKSLFGARSNEYRQISKLKFIKIKG